MKNWQFALLMVILGALLLGLGEAVRRLQYIQEILEEQWTIMDSDAYERIDRYKDMSEGELFEAEEF